MSDFNFTTVPDITFAHGCSAQLMSLCKQLGITKPLIVSDQGVVEHGLLALALSVLDQYSLYDEVIADPPERVVIAASELGTTAGCDGVVGFGGGSSMDVAKLVAVLMVGEQSLTDMYGVDQVRSARLPLIQVPTTAGTGSEATSVAIVTTGESTKAGVVSRILVADAVLCDPELTLGLPPEVTAATGIDAMVHAIEAFTSKRLKNPISDTLAERALRAMSTSIETAVTEGTNRAARSNMMLGALLAGQAFANAPVGAVHALAYPLGGIYHIPHGLSNSLVLPHVLRFNASHASPLYDHLASVLDLTFDPEVGAFVMADYFDGLARRLGLPTNLSEVGINESGLAELAEQAILQQRLLINNPRPLELDQALELYHQAL